MYCPFVLDTDWDGVVRQCTQSERTSLPLSRLSWHGKGGDDSNLHPAPADVMMWDSHGCSHHSTRGNIFYLFLYIYFFPAISKTKIQFQFLLFSSSLVS